MKIKLNRQIGPFGPGATLTVREVIPHGEFPCDPEQYMVADGTIVPGDAAEVVKEGPQPQRESEPARGHSWPDGYRQIVNGWWENMPVEMQRAFYEDPLVHRTMVECARQRMTTEQMLWRLAQELFRTVRSHEDQLIRMIEHSSRPFVQPP